MDDTDLRLDGNAAAGLLQEVFGAELTVARRTCATCGHVGAVGELHAYVHAPGLVLRCPRCQSVALRIVHARGRYLVELTGTAVLELPG